MGTLSKTLGAYGGYVAGPGILTEYLANTARSLIFSTALPPAAIAAAAASLEIVRREPELADRPLAHARRFTELMGLPEAESAIVPVIIGESEKALAVSAALEEAGFLVAAIRPPTVPRGQARLRIAFSALHTPEMIEALAAAMKERMTL
jgi:8-amino-7-oxononanoate synthase